MGQFARLPSKEANKCPDPLRKGINPSPVLSWKLADWNEEASGSNSRSQRCFHR